MATRFFSLLRARFFGTPSETAVEVGVNGESNPRLSIDAGGRLNWGAGSAATDVNLYRDAADVLKTDDTFKAASLFVDAIEVDTTGAVTSDVLTFDGTKFAPAAPTGGGGGASTLDELTDVAITAPEAYQVLRYDGTEWINEYPTTVSLVENAETTTLQVGEVVYLFGGTGNHASVKRADNGSDTTSSKTVGVVATAIPAGNTGPVVTRGYVDGIDLSTGYSAGDVLWLGSNGAFTTTKPSSPDHLVFVGVVVRTTSNGIIYVATQNGYELEEIHDVTLTSLTSGDFLKWNGSLWVNDVIDLGTDTTGNYMIDVSAGTGISVSHTPSEGSTATVSLDATLDEISDVTITSATPGDFLKWDGSSWVNDPINLGTDTTGNYVSDVTAGTGVTVTHTPGEGSSPTVAIGQAVGTTDTPTFVNVNISGTPSQATHAVTKDYVDSIAAGIDWHQAVRLTTAAVLPNSPAYSNGTSGVGATLTATAFARLSVDGTNATTGDRVLVKNQSTATENGVYLVTEQGNAVDTYWVLTRATDFDSSPTSEIKTGEAVFTTAGATNVNQGFVLTSTGSGTDGAHVLNTDSLTFTQFTGTQAFTAGDGLVQSGNTLNAVGNAGRIVVNADDIDLATISSTTSSGSATTTLVSDITVDSYGRVTNKETSAVDFSTVIEKSTITAKGDLIVGASSGTPAILGAGTDGYILKANSAATNGLEWGVAGSTVTISDTAPSSPADGDLWWESDTGKLKIYYNDGTSSQWVDAYTSELGTTVGDVTLTGIQTLTNKTLTEPVVNSAVLKSPEERWNSIGGTGPSGAINIDASTSTAWHWRYDSTGNMTLNFRWASGTTLDSKLEYGDSITFVVSTLNGATAYYVTGVTVDGSAVTPKWQGGAAPSAGTASSRDVYVFTILKDYTGWEVFASLTAFA